jgi:DNA-binding SARP family transcriptional activator
MHRVEIRLLGPLQVRRADGSSVDVREFRTGKTADLLRMLAVRLGTTLTVDAAIEALWPAAERSRGLASLRTAACQIRAVLRENCISRNSDGLRLEGAWVDTVAFRQLTAAQRNHVLERAWDQVVTLARAADILYVDDLSAHDPSSMLLSDEHRALQSARIDMLLEAADAAVTLNWYRDGADFSQRVLAVNPFSERACRALMASHAGIGEIRPALVAYERCRTVLAEELGADPSPQTQALYLGLLASPPSLLANIRSLVAV